MNLQEVKLLHAYNAWASHRIFDALASVKPEDLTKDMNSSHRSILGTMAHLVGAEKIWLSRLVGQPDMKLTTLSEMPTLADVHSVWEKTGFGMAKFLGAMSDKKLQETFTMTTAGGEAFTHVVWQAIQHLVDHSSYHRGQVVTLLRQMNYTPPSTGMIRFYREAAKLP